MKRENPYGVLSPAAKTHGGAAVPHSKTTAEKETIRMPAPAKVLLPMQQHIGATCRPVVKAGDLVKVGQLVGDSDQPMSVPVHASVSGKVVKIEDTVLTNGRRVPAVAIESDGEMALYEGVEPPKAESRAEFIKAVRESGLAGLGGAGFPAHIKLDPPADKKIDTLIVNAAECEPFITVDYRECLENSWDILTGVHTIKEMLEIPHVIIAIEDNKPKAFDVLKSIADNSADVDHTVRLMVLPSRYPQGAEKVLVQATTGRRVPMGGLPADVGCLVMNVTSVAFIARYLKTGKPLVSRTLTVDGNAVANPQNIRLPLGTPIQEAIDFCGGFSKDPAKILVGGPMMGMAVDHTSIPIIKNNNAILAFDRKFAQFHKERACIRCGRCASACPMNLMPTLIERMARINDAQSLKRIGVNVCMECGSCAYSCPSSRPLVQYMRLAKEVVRKERG